MNQHYLETNVYLCSRKLRKVRDIVSVNQDAKV